ncbi:MAG: hypothetical protein NZ517_00650 [Candidatus Nitrosocaldus sp.]|nr:hypothetical protein [Candidatus Nitrosocaldus sp.]MDW8000136.1 hypothetical protein [Candidatus Nitrosocaldus sp.]
MRYLPRVRMIHLFVERVRGAPSPMIVREVHVEEVAVDTSLDRFRVIGESLEELHEGSGAMQSVFMYEFNDYRWVQGVCKEDRSELR